VQDDGVQVVGQKSSGEAVGEGVGDDAQGDEEGGHVNAQARHGFNSSSPSQQQHGRDQHVGQEAEGEEDLVRRAAPPCSNDLTNGVRVGSLALDLDGEDAKQQDLYRCSRTIPKGTSDPVQPGDVAALQEGGGPGPLRADDGGNQTCLDRAPGGVEVLARLLGPAVAVLQPHEEGGEEAEHGTKAQANGPPNAFRERRGVAGAVPSLGVAHGCSQKIIP